MSSPSPFPLAQGLLMLYLLAAGSPHALARETQLQALCQWGPPSCACAPPGQVTGNQLQAWLAAEPGLSAQVQQLGVCTDAGPARLAHSDTHYQGVGSAVHLVDGHVYQQEVDMPALPGVLGLEVVRHYHSGQAQSASAGLLGRGWKLSYETQAYASGSSIEIVQADGRRIVFSQEPDSPAEYTSEFDGVGTVTRERSESGAQEALVWRWNDGRQLRFNAQGRLELIRLASGQQVRLQYSQQGARLDKITDPQGRSLQLVYAQAGEAPARLLRIDSPIGAIHYGYAGERSAKGAAAAVPAQAPLVQVRLPAMVDKAGPAAALVRQYFYEDSRHAHALTGISLQGQGHDGRDLQERLLSYGYDAQGMAVRSVQALADGTQEHLSLERPEPGHTVLTHSGGQRTVYRHDTVAGQWRLLQVNGPGCARCVTGQQRYQYDSANRLVERTQIDQHGQALGGVRRALDAYGRVLTVSRINYVNGQAQPAQWQVRYGYGSGSRQHAPERIVRPSVVAGQEHLTLVRYNPAGQALQITESGYSPLDAEGLPLASGTQPTALQRSTHYRYGQRAGHSVLVQIDSSPPGSLGTRPYGGEITRLEWDVDGGFVQRMTLPGGRERHFEYAPTTGRLLLATHSWEQQQRRIALSYTPAGLLRSQTIEVLDPQHARVIDSRRTAYDYSAHGRLLSAQGPDAGSDTVAPAPAASPMPVMAQPAAAGLSLDGGVAAPERSAQRLVDDFGREVGLRTAGQGWRTARHDAAGRIVQLRDPRGVITSARYDFSGRLVEMQHRQPGAILPETVVRRTWQGPYQLTETVSDSHKRTLHKNHYRYHHWGQVAEHSADYFDGATPLSHSFSLRMLSQYDRQGRLLARTLPSGERLHYNYESATSEAGHRLSIAHGRGPAWTQTLTGWLPDGLLKASGLKTVLAQRAGSTPVPGEAGDHAVSAAGGLQEAALLPAHSATGGRDAAGLPAQLSTSMGRLLLSWNAAGQLAQVQRSEDQSVVARYRYDGQGRRISKWTAQSQEYYFYEGHALVAVARAPANAPKGVAPQVHSEYVHMGCRAVAWLQAGKSYLLDSTPEGELLAVTSAQRAPAQRAVLWQSPVRSAGAWPAQTAQSPAQTAMDPGLRLYSQYADAETGLLYQPTGYYEPRQAHFISPGASALSLNGAVAALAQDNQAWADTLAVQDPLCETAAASPASRPGRVLQIEAAVR